MITDRQLRYFLVLADERHFGRAAARIGISQPSLSQQIKRLEEHVGVQLVDRSGAHGLTDAGQALAARARPAIDGMDEAIAAARETGGVTATIRIAVPRRVYAREPVVKELLDRLRRRFPAARLHLTELLSAPALAALRAGEVDAALAYAPIDAEDVDILPLVSAQLMVAVPSRHRLADRRGIRLVDLRDERIATWSRDALPDQHDELVAACRRSGFEPDLVEISPQPGALTRFVAAGGGACVVSASWARGWRGAGVVFRPLSQPKIVLNVVLAWNHDDGRPLCAAIVAAAEAARRATS